MADVLELIESFRAEEASVAKLFGGEGVQAGNRHGAKELAEAQKFLNDIKTGKRKFWQFEEAMSRSDFPILMADILDRQLIGSYNSLSPVWPAYIKRGTVNDFRNVKRVAVDGSESVLTKVGEQEQYPESSLQDKKDEYAVAKYGRRIAIDWEAMINDDLGGFDNLPGRLALAAHRTEQKFASGLWLGPNGPDSTLYSSGHKNIITGNPVLSINGLQKAFQVLSEMKDFDEEPITIEAVTLVVPFALEVTANNILHSMSIDVNEFGGTEKSRLRIENWMKNKVQLVVDPYIGSIATSANAATTWALFATPGTSRPFAEMGFLRGHETPALFEKAPDARQVGGGEVRESFLNDTYEWKVRHVLGGTKFEETGGYKSTVASNGSGS